MTIGATKTHVRERAIDAGRTIPLQDLHLETRERKEWGWWADMKHGHHALDWTEPLDSQFTPVGHRRPSETQTGGFRPPARRDDVRLTLLRGRGLRALLL